jgi:hypothetical protein
MTMQGNNANGKNIMLFNLKAITLSTFSVRKLKKNFELCLSQFLLYMIRSTFCAVFNSIVEKSTGGSISVWTPHPYLPLDPYYNPEKNNSTL